MISAIEALRLASQHESPQNVSAPECACCEAPCNELFPVVEVHYGDILKLTWGINGGLGGCTKERRRSGLARILEIGEY